MTTPTSTPLSCPGVPLDPTFTCDPETGTWVCPSTSCTTNLTTVVVNITGSSFLNGSLTIAQSGVVVIAAPSFTVSGDITVVDSRLEVNRDVLSDFTLTGTFLSAQDPSPSVNDPLLVPSFHIHLCIHPIIPPYHHFYRHSLSLPCSKPRHKSLVRQHVIDKLHARLWGCQ